MLRFLGQTLLVALLAMHCAAQSPVVPAGSRFVMSHFMGNNGGGDERLYISVSADGLHWTALNNGNPVWQPDGWAGFVNVVRDPAIIYENGQYWVAYTSGNYGKHASFGLVKSADLLHWSFVGEISTAIAGATDPLTWNPTFFRDGDGAVHLFISISPINGTTYNPQPAMRSYELHPLAADWSQWSVPALVMLPSTNTNEFWAWKEGDTYHGIYIDYSQPYLGNWFHVTSSGLLSGWAISQRLGFTTHEGGMLIKKPAGGYRLFFEPGNGASPPGYRYADCENSFSGFTPTQTVTSEVPMRNGKMTALVATTSYSSWQTEKLNSLPQFDQIPGADPDRDGLANLLEYACDQNPTTRDTTGTPQCTVITSGSAQYLGMSFRRLPQAAGLMLALEASSDLATWDASAGAVVSCSMTLLTDGAEWVQARDAIAVEAAPRRFLRLRALAR